MIRAWTCGPIQGFYVCTRILWPYGEVPVGDTGRPSVTLMGSGPPGAWFRMRIQHTCSTDDYLDSLWVHFSSMVTMDTWFRPWAARYPGLYRMQCTADSSDSTWRYFTAVEPGGVGERSPQFVLDKSGIEVGPNPLRTAAEIRYRVTGKSRVKLRILDTRGRVARTLVSGCSSPGVHLAVWDARDDQGLPAARGIYFVRLESQDCQETRKVVLAR